MGFNGTSLWWLSPFPDGICSSISHIVLGWIAGRYILWLLIVLIGYQIFNYHYGVERGCLDCRIQSINEYLLGVIIGIVMKNIK